MSENYSEYIATEHWANLREMKFIQVGRFCQVCHTPNKLHVHHIHYRELYDCSVNDLAVLCERCHDTLHRQLKKKCLKSNEVELTQIILLVNSLDKHHQISTGPSYTSLTRRPTSSYKDDCKPVRKAIKQLQTGTFTVPNAIALRNALNRFIEKRS